MDSASSMRIAVAMSGGVDSSVAAALLKRQGHEVTGFTMQLFDAAVADTSPVVRAVHDARAAAERIGIAHRVVDCREAFRRDVVDPFVAAYAGGLTPNPCTICNAKLKFGELLRAAKADGAEALATGHYVRRLSGDDGPELHCAVDLKRDQSYFLFAVDPALLGALHFPLGEMSKAEVRALAAAWGLANADKPDSQDICFVAGGRYDALVERLKPEAMRPGAIVDRTGKVVGAHKGIVHFTVGQRRRLDIAGNERNWFVLKLDAARAEVVVGPREALMKRQFRLEGVHWLADPREAATCTVKVRSMRPSVPARVAAGADGTALVDMLEPEEAVAPGQACVFYRGTRVLGGGWIAPA
jgi:tRNA-uridine 2-sulfurtransferase